MIFSLRYEWKDKFCIVSERIWKFQVGQWFEINFWQRQKVTVATVSILFSKRKTNKEDIDWLNFQQ